MMNMNSPQQFRTALVATPRVSRPVTYLGHAAATDTGMCAQIAERGLTMTTSAICAHTKSFVGAWNVNPAFAHKDHSQRERPT